MQSTIPFAHIGPHTKLPSRSRFLSPERIWLGDAIFMEEGVVFDTGNLLFNQAPDPIRIRVGNRVTIGRNALVSAVNRVEIGNNVLFAQNVYVADNDHHYTDIGIPIRDQYFSGYEGSVRIEDDCWLGRNAVIIGSSRPVTIGRGSVVGANAVVTFDVPSYSVVAGNPGRLVKMYDPAVDDFVRVKGPDDILRVLASRERLGVHPRPVRVDLGQFHHLLAPLPIEGLAPLAIGMILEPAHHTSWQPWVSRYLATFGPEERVSLVLGIPRLGEWESTVTQVSGFFEGLEAEPTPSVVLQPFAEEERPAFIRSLSALVVDADADAGELHCLQAMACGVPVLGAPRQRVARWLQDGLTGLAGEEDVLRRAESASLAELGRGARALMERTFGVPHVPADAQVFYYTPPSDQVGL